MRVKRLDEMRVKRLDEDTPVMYEHVAQEPPRLIASVWVVDKRTFKGRTCSHCGWNALALLNNGITYEDGQLVRLTQNRHLSD